MCWRSDQGVSTYELNCYVHYLNTWVWLKWRTSTFVKWGVVSCLQITKMLPIARAILCENSSRNAMNYVTIMSTMTIE
jgi:hypothetical protein